MTSHKITIQDIANLLHISKSTVSRALHDHPDISDETKKAVKDLAKIFDYKPNRAALTLRYNSSKLIGLIIPEIYCYFFPSVVNGIEKELSKKGYNLLTLQSKESYEREKENIEILLANNVEGILASVSRETKKFDHFKKVLSEHIPIVFFDRVPREIEADMVLLDDIEGAYKAVKHLAEKGRKKIAICIGNLDLLISINRLKGYKKALEEFNLQINESFIISAQSAKEAKEKTSQLLSLPNKPDAIFAISDLTMTGVIQAIYRSHLSVPEDISLIGFSEEPFSLMYKPSITSILPMGNQIGKVAAKRLLKKIKNKDKKTYTPKVILLKSELIVRDST